MTHCLECMRALPEEGLTRCPRCGALLKLAIRTADAALESGPGLGVQLQVLLAGVVIGLGLAWFIGELVVTLPASQPSMLPLLPVGVGLVWYAVAERWSRHHEAKAPSVPGDDGPRGVAVPPRKRAVG